jgi:hypothetical protein
MQVSPQVGWDPRYVDHRLPWAYRLFVVYLFVVLGISVAKSASVILRLLPFTKSSFRNTRDKLDFSRAWEICSNKIQCMKRIVVMTVLLSVLTPAYLLLNVLGIFAAEKVFLPQAPGAFLGAVIEVLTVFVLGILTGSLIYAACAFLEGALVRRKESWTSHKFSESRQPTS